MNSDMTEALAMLNGLSDGAMEYPEAKFSVAIALKLNDRQIQRLQILYDSQFDS